MSLFHHSPGKVCVQVAWSRLLAWVTRVCGGRAEGRAKNAVIIVVHRLDPSHLNTTARFLRGSSPSGRLLDSPAGPDGGKAVRCTPSSSTTGTRSPQTRAQALAPHALRAAQCRHQLQLRAAQCRHRLRRDHQEGG